MRLLKMRSVASVLALSLLASAAGAAEPSPTLWNAAREAGTRAPLNEQAQAPAATGNPRTDSSFFKTKAGKLTLGLMVVGLGATVYSVSHDRKPVKSPIR